MSKWIRKVVMVAVPSLLLVAALFRPDACCAFAPPAAAPAFDTHGEILDRGGTKYPISAIATPALIKHIQPVADMEEFESHIASKSKQVVAVWFQASWCRKCKYVGARLRHLDEHLPPHVTENVALVSVDVNKVAGVPQMQKIKDLPTIQFFTGGKQVSSYVATDRGEVLYGNLERHILAAMGESKV